MNHAMKEDSIEFAKWGEIVNCAYLGMSQEDANEIIEKFEEFMKPRNIKLKNIEELKCQS